MTGGSAFYDYNGPSKVYSNTRKAVGVNLIDAELERMQQEGLGKIEEMALLDGGAGTGNYALELAPKVGRVCAFEYNDGMIATMKQRASEMGLKNTEVVQGSLRDTLPFKDGEFHVVIMNQVVHHLDDLEDCKAKNYKVNTHLAKEYFRVLKPGGAVLVNFTTPDQNVKGWWPQHMIHRAASTYAERCISSSDLDKVYTAAGFGVQTHVILDPLQGDYYFSMKSVLDESFRDGDSLWRHVTEDELRNVVATVKEVIDKGPDEEKAYLHKHDAWRRENGQSVTLVGRKEKK